jgi:hypothetical protein|tara:strand:+ start:277 stop:453 length:177 start_codon:yes stop_codon:yes gene_type:complete
MKNSKLQSAMEWAKTQTNQVLLMTAVSGLNAQKTGAWKNWSEVSRMMSTAASQTLKKQ